jgi:hypothetical protein
MVPGVRKDGLPDWDTVARRLGRHFILVCSATDLIAMDS